ncbi:zinc finger protein 429-like isoform X2 [Periophthalmus magnuspinnatus]|uniref:zinc finger protein 429-like isoform X2 n=1 Tax=Periophthalmus magnuspinnatus TaxID=409849 RepID=UPI00145C1500|nr:zinc finger protein 429-like isoform X2 [Periophthalmus magnuspinnatus]
MSAPQPGPCALSLRSLRLLVSPLRLTCAALWGIARQRAVEHYGLLEDFISTLHRAIPGLLSPSERVRISLGLRAKVVLDMCRRDGGGCRQHLEPELRRMEELVLELEEEDSGAKTKASFDRFSKFVFSLLDDPHEKDAFLQKTSEFDLKFDSSLQNLVRNLLLHLENLLPVPSLEHTSRWLGLCPSVLKECEDILNEPDPLHELIQQQKHNCHFVEDFFSGVSGSTDEQSETKTTQLQSSDARGDEAQTEEGVPSVEVTLSFDDDDDEDEYTMDYNHEYQRPSVCAKSSRCPACGLTFDNPSLLSKHSVSGDCIEENAVFQVDLDSDALRSEHEPLTVDADVVPKRRGYTDHIVCLLCGQIYTLKTLLEHQKVCVVRYEREKRAAAAMRVEYAQKRRDQGFKPCIVVVGRLSSSREIAQDKTCKFSSKERSKASVQRRLFPKNREMPVLKNNLYSILIQPCNLNSSKNNTETESGSQRRESENSACTKPMKCTLCDQTFSKTLLMKRHYFNIHRVKGSYQCPSCKRSFVRLCDMVKHHQNKRLVECETCRRCFTKLTVLKKHKTQYNNTCATPHICETCGKPCLTAGVLKQHRNVHRVKNEQTVCTYCGKKFSSKFCLRVHMNRHTGGFPCPICPKVFYQKTCLKRHVNKHNGLEPYLCDVCGKGWATPAYLRIHMVTHTEDRPFKCDRCDMSFKREVNLKCHFTSKHTDLRPYVCSVCGAAYKHSSMLYEHVMKHTGVPRHVCPKCGSGFARKYQLRMHREKRCADRKQVS